MTVIGKEPFRCRACRCRFYRYVDPVARQAPPAVQVGEPVRSVGTKINPVQRVVGLQNPMPPTKTAVDFVKAVFSSLARQLPA